jgi:hypothetical protein
MLPNVLSLDEQTLQDINGPTAWRSVFSLDPNRFFANFAPIVGGLFTCLVHLPGDETWNPIGRSWTRYTCWFLMVTIFANLGFAGKLPR